MKPRSILRKIVYPVVILAFLVEIGDRIYQNFRLTSPQNEKIENTDSQEFIEKKLRINTNTGPSLTIRIKSEDYEKLVNTPRNAFSQLNPNLRNYARSSKSLEEISNIILNNDRELVAKFSDPYETSENIRIYYPRHMLGTDYMRVLEFMRANIRYLSDKDLGYAQFPEETLVKSYGDCEDQACLAASLLKNHRSVGLVFIDLKEVGHETIAIELKPNERLPEAIVYDSSSHLKTMQELNNKGLLPENISIHELYETAFQNNPGCIKKRVKAATIKYQDKTYFLIETTASAYDIVDKINGKYNFVLLN